MSQNLQNIEAFFSEFNQQFEPVPDVIAETATEYFKEALISKQWDGDPYPPYKDAAKEPTRGSLMMRSNNLFSSIQPTIVTRTQVRVSAGGAKAPYARVHNEGQRVRGTAYVRPYTNNNLFGKGKRAQIKGHTRKVDFQMPKRQFMGVSQIMLDRARTRIINQLNAGGTLLAR